MPFVFGTCPHCKQENSYDRASLEASAEAARLFRRARTERLWREYRVVCSHCFKPFKIKVPEEGGREPLR